MNRRQESAKLTAAREREWRNEQAVLFSVCHLLADVYVSLNLRCHWARSGWQGQDAKAFLIHPLFRLRSVGSKVNVIAKLCFEMSGFNFLEDAELSSFPS